MPEDTVYFTNVCCNSGDTCATESVTGLFRMALLRPVAVEDRTLVQTEVQQGQVDADLGLGPSPHPEIVLLLHTSGTSGNKKLVPYSLESLVVGVACIISSWRLVSLLKYLRTMTYMNNHFPVCPS